MRRSALSRSLPLAALALLALAAGCGHNEVKVYKVDASDVVATTPPPAIAVSPSAMPATLPPGLSAPDNSSFPKLNYTLPDGWKEKPLTQFRVASFEISGDGQTAEVSVIPLGGTSGGDAANVNRWRGQVGQPPLAEAGLQKSAEPVAIAGQATKLYDLAGASPGSGDAQRIIGAMLPVEDSVWYFKMMGDDALVEKNKAAFVAFLKSVEFQAPAAAAAPAAMDLGQLPPSHPAIPGMAAGTPATAAADGQPVWTVPADWQAGELAQFLIARYVIQGAGGTSATVNVSELAGEGGGLLPNLNRWRNQLGQPPMTAAEAAQLPSVEASGVKAVVVDFTGTDARAGQPARLVGVVLPLNGQTWFYKLSGNPDVVAKQKDALIAFVQSAQYPAAK